MMKYFFIQKYECSPCPNGKQPDRYKTGCENCPVGTAGENGTCEKCIGRSYSRGGAASCTPITRNVNETPDVCVSMRTINGGNWYERDIDPYSMGSVAEWNGCCTTSDCAGDLECVSFTNLPKRCLDDSRMKGWCGHSDQDHLNYKGDIYWDNVDKTQRCFTKDCDERSYDECLTIGDINRYVFIRCRFADGECKPYR